MIGIAYLQHIRQDRMRKLNLILPIIAVCSLGLFAQTPNISGDWDGPNDLILHFTYNPSTKKVAVDYCGIYRNIEWSPTARIENGYLVLTQNRDNDGNSFSARLHIDSKDKMTGNISMKGYGESLFNGTASITRSSQPYYSQIMGIPGNNPDIDTSLASCSQSSDYELNYAPLSNEPVGPTPQVPESVWNKNWKFQYGKDKFGDENRSDPRLIRVGEFVGFIITPLNGIYLIFPDASFAIIDYADLSIKTKNGEIKEMPLRQISETVFQLTNREDNYTMLDILDEGHFKLVLELSEYGVSKNFKAAVTNETLGVINAMEYYFMDIPGFQDAWNFYGD